MLGSFAALRADAGDHAGAVAVLDEAVALAEVLGDAQSRTLALATSTWIDWQAGDHSRVPDLLGRLAECEADPSNQWSLA